ncbi:MAG: insulinase family protein, partial [Burkholderiales bacterium]
MTRNVNRIAAALATLVVGISLPQSALLAAEMKLPVGVSAGPAFEGISEFRLANGLRVLLLPDPSVDTITSNIVYRVGSRHEGYGESGMAHLLEHMLFKGTIRHPSPRTEFLQRGARFNGTTSYDRTNYFQTFPANTDNLEWAVRLEADRMVNARIAKSDLESEMTVVRNEFESGENSPFNVLRERMSATAYLWHSYGRAIIGARSDIENVPIERLQAFYRQYYQPDNAVFILAGRFEPAQALGFIAKEFGALPKPTRTLPTTYTEEPTQDGERQVVLRRAGNVQIVAAMYHIAPGTHPDYVPLDVLTSLISAQPSGRLHRALIEPGLAASVFGVERQLTEAGSAYFGATVREGGSIDAARDALLQAVESFATQPVTAEELERARTSLMSAVERSLRDSRSLATLLSEFVAMGDWRVLFWYRDQLAKVTREDVQRVALGYFKRQNRTLGLFMPTGTADRAEIPRAPNLTAMLQDYNAAPGTTTVAAGEAFDPSPEAIEARLIRRTLPGGLKLALLPKKMRGEQVIASLTLRWGDEQTKSDRNLACGVAGAMLSRGTQKRSREQLRDDLARLRTNVSVTTEGATIDTNRTNLAAALTAAAEMLRQPKFSATEFEQVRRQALTGLDAQRTDPSALATLELQRHLNRYPATHWYYTPTMDERAARLQALTLQDVQRCHADL